MDGNLDRPGISIPAPANGWGGSCVVVPLAGRALASPQPAVAQLLEAAGAAQVVAMYESVQQAVGLYLLGWLIFTFYMTIAAVKTNAAVLWVFITLTATYLLLTLAKFGINPSDLTNIGGYVGITCGVTAWYVAFAHVTNATFGRKLIPTWPLT